jgi:hypothetical protein
VLVHGSFSDHHTNWEFVRPLFERQFTVYAIARRGRGETDATQGHSLDECRSIGGDSFFHRLTMPSGLLADPDLCQLTLDLPAKSDVAAQTVASRAIQGEPDDRRVHAVQAGHRGRIPAGDKNR